MPEPIETALTNLTSDTLLTSGTALRPRRDLLKAMGLAALALGGAGTLGACSSGSQTAPPANSQPGSSATNSASSSTGSSSSSGGASAKGTVIPKSKVPQGGGIIEGKVVVTQPSAGTFKAFSAVCTHQGCLVNSISGGQIGCPCHGSHFSISDGSVQSGPAPQPLPPVKVTASGKDLIIST